MRRLVLTSMVLVVACGTGEGRLDLLIDSPRPPSAWTWQAFPVSLEVLPGFTSKQQRAIEAAALEWNAAMGRTAIELRFAPPEVAQSATPAVALTQYPFQQTLYLGCTTPCPPPESVRKVDQAMLLGYSGLPSQGADIAINGLYDWNTTLRSEYPDGTTATTDLRTVVLHEMGHFLGLNHTPVTDDDRSIMVDTVKAMKTPRHAVSNGDRARILDLYPDGSAQ